MTDDPRLPALPDIHGHAKGEHKPFAEERPIPYSARLMFLWFFHAARRGAPRFMMVTDHVNYLTFEDPAAVNLVRRALRLAQAGDIYGAAETAGVEIAQATTVSEALRAGMRFTIGAEVDNDPRSRPDAANVVEAMRPDGIVRSIHFLPVRPEGYPEDFLWPFDNPEFIAQYDIVGVERTWELYIQTLIEAISTQPTHIVGHLYVPGKFGHWPDDAVLDRYEDDVLAACAERNIAIELNSRIFYRSNDTALKAKHLELYARLLRKAKERDVGIALGSDAHSPRDQGRGFDILLPLLDEAEINEIVFPINGQHARVALRVDRIRRPAKPAPEAPVADESEPVPVFPAGAVTEQPAPAAPQPAAPPEHAPEPVRPPESAPAGDAPAADATAEPQQAEAPAAPPPVHKPIKAKPKAVKAMPAPEPEPVAAETHAAEDAAAEDATAEAPVAAAAAVVKPAKASSKTKAKPKAVAVAAPKTKAKPAAAAAAKVQAPAKSAAATSKSTTAAKKSAAPVKPVAKPKPAPKAAAKPAKTKAAAKPPAKRATPAAGATKKPAKTKAAEPTH